MITSCEKSCFPNFYHTIVIGVFRKTPILSLSLRRSTYFRCVAISCVAKGIVKAIGLLG